MNSFGGSVWRGFKNVQFQLMNCSSLYCWKRVNPPYFTRTELLSLLCFVQGDVSRFIPLTACKPDVLKATRSSRSTYGFGKRSTASNTSLLQHRKRVEVKDKQLLDVSGTTVCVTAPLTQTLWTVHPQIVSSLYHHMLVPLSTIFWKMYNNLHVNSLRGDAI